MQKQGPIAVVSSVTIAVLLTPSLADAVNIGDVDLVIQPRLEAGLMYYEYEQDALGTTVVQQFNGTTNSITSSNQGKLKFKDTLPTVLGGITFFIDDRFFIDLSAQKAYNGNDVDTQSASFLSTDSFTDPPETGVSTFSQLRKTRFDADFDRIEYAISLGYLISKQIAVFAGYKRAKTEFDEIKGSGEFTNQSAVSSTLGSLTSESSGKIESVTDFDFKYDGPFFGATYGLDVSKAFFKGSLSLNVGLAFLDAEAETEEEETLLSEPDPGLVTRFVQRTKLDSDGDTLGATFGINWRGLIKQDASFQYSLGLNAYQYDFDADDSDQPDMKETAVNFRVGIAYAF